MVRCIGCWSVAMAVSNIHPDSILHNAPWAHTPPYTTYKYIFVNMLTHWGRVTHTCVSKQTIIALDNGLSPGRHKAIIWTNAGILLIQTLGTNFSEILSEIHTFWLKKMHLEMWSGKWRPFYPGLKVLRHEQHTHAWRCSLQNAVANVRASKVARDGDYYFEKHCQISNTRRTKFQNLNVSRLVLQLSLSKCSWSSADR